MSKFTSKIAARVASLVEEFPHQTRILGSFARGIEALSSAPSAMGAIVLPREEADIARSFEFCVTRVRVATTPAETRKRLSEMMACCAWWLAQPFLDEAMADE